MPRGALTTRDRTVIAACAIGALAVALFTPHVWQWLFDHPVGGSIEVAMWVATVLAPIPACLALAAVVLTARAPVGTVIAVVSGVVAVIANLGRFGSLIGTEDYVRWMLWAVLLGCALLGADAMAWRFGSFTAATGVLAGVLVAILETAVQLSMYRYGDGGLRLTSLPVEFWLREYGVPAAMLVLVGALAGAAVQRRVVPQETAGLA